jgi:DNA-binding transcriptional regulator YiaG
MKKPLTRTIAGHKLTVDVEVGLDPETHEETVSLAEAQRAELEMAAALAESGPVVGETFVWMRKALGLQSKQLARLLDVRPETITRWETDVVPVDRAAWFTLSELVLERIGRPRDLHQRLERLAV